MFRTTARVARLGLLLFAGACAGLDVENPNNPDVERALGTGDDVRAIATGNLNQWYMAATNVYPWLAQSTACDCGAANFGNFGMRFHNTEPRDPYINSTSAGDDRLVTQDAWGNWYATLGASNDVLRATERHAAFSALQQWLHQPRQAGIHRRAGFYAIARWLDE